jgi:hypothetical protein
MTNRLQGLFPFDPNRDATAADADRIKCPLDCEGRPSFRGRRNRLHRFVCRECNLEFEVVTEPYRPGGAA